MQGVEKMNGNTDRNHGQVRRAVRATLWLAPALVAVPFAAAQDRAGAAGLEEVVVTARKSEEKLTEVPLVIAAYSADELAKRNVTSLSDIAQYTAGFSFENYSGGTTPAPLIRGLTQNALTDRNQNVGTFVNGVHVQQQGNIDFSIMDLERVEIVKGPQNAQYGRSSFAGAINWVSAKPNLSDWAGTAALTVGTDERFDVSGAISIPLWRDKLAVRIAGMQSEFDGTWKNNTPYGPRAIPVTSFGYAFKGTDNNLAGWDREARSISLRFRPVEALTIDAMYYRSETENEAGAGTAVQPFGPANIPSLGFVNPLTCSPRITASATVRAGGNQLFCGEIKLTPDQAQADPRHVGVYTHTDLTTARVEYKFNDAYSATYVYGRGTYDARNYAPSPSIAQFYVFGDSTIRQPGTGQPGLTWASNPFTDQNSESHELRVDGKVGQVTWRIGYYTSDVDDVGAAALIERRLPLSADPTGQVTFGQFAPSLTLSNFFDETDAIFGSIAIPFGAWTFEAEARQAEETRKQLPLNRTTEFKETTPRVNLKWQPRAGWMFYVSAARGTKAGGFNGITADVATFEPEENTTFEIGGKQSLLEGTLQLNYAVFLIDWKDLQLSVPDTIPSRPGIQDANYIGNVSGAQAKGAELEAIYLVNDNLRLNAALSYVESTFDDDVIDTTFGRLCETNGAAACVFLPRSAALPFGGSPIGGNDLPRTPRSKISLGAEYTVPVGDTMSLAFRGDYNYQNKYYIENLNLGIIPDRGLLNVSATLSGGDGAWSASAWARNALDEVYVSSSFAVSVTNGYAPALGEGRTMGVTLRYNF